MAGIGPISFAGMMLADLGAEVTRIERPGRWAAWAPRRCSTAAGARARSTSSRRPGVEEVLGARRRVRGADRGLPPGRHGAPRARSRGLPRPQPGAGLRADDRLGTVGPLRPHGRPRHHLPGDLRRPPHGRRGGRQADPAGQPARRLRRGRHLPRLRRDQCAAARAGDRGRPGGRRGDRRRRRLGHRDAARLPRAGGLARRARRQPARRRRPLLRLLPLRGRWLGRGRGARAAVLRGAAGEAGAGRRRGARRTPRPGDLARDPRALHRQVRRARPRRVARALRRLRLLRRPGPLDARGPRGRPRPRPRHLRRGRRHAPARPGPALQRHPARPPRAGVRLHQPPR